MQRQEKTGKKIIMAGLAFGLGLTSLAGAYFLNNSQYVYKSNDIRLTNYKGNTYEIYADASVSPELVQQRMEDLILFTMEQDEDYDEKYFDTHELTDELIKTYVEGYSSVEEFRKEIESEIIAENEWDIYLDTVQVVLDDLVEKSKFPNKDDTTYDYMKDEFYQQYETSALNAGYESLEEYIEEWSMKTKRTS